MDVDYVIGKDEPLAVTNTSTEAEIALYKHWERSNRFSVMFIKTKISTGIRGLVNQHTKVRDLLKAIDEQFVTSDKALASTLIMKFCSMRLDTVRGVCEHIMQIRDTAAQHKKLENSDLIDVATHEWSPVRDSKRLYSSRNQFKVGDIIRISYTQQIIGAERLG
ncbi:hypothetical protein F0562_005585 [Nyssa sinensis]|uniref:Uncharacterized protein n=1 Tax=Nyssa sinensis TaxID=561372 RepID=A0A5J5ANZ5_9ASTE|nr:hypothetical protein F0562_005585 [Nyssa sinensis]